MSASPTWQEASKRRLEEALEALLARLQGRSTDGGPASADTDREADARTVPANALDRLVAKLGLSLFERDLLVLLAGCELDHRFAEALDGARPTFSQALARLEGAHWSAIAPGGPLRRARLVTIESGPTLALGPLRIEEPVLHELVGVPQLDEALRPYLEVLAPADTLDPGAARTAERLAAAWADPEAALPPLVLLRGQDATEVRTVVAAAAGVLGHAAFALDAGLLPADPATSESLLELWQRDAVLHELALLIELPATPGGSRTARRWLERVQGLVATCGEVGEGWPSARTRVRLDLEPTTVEERRQRWTIALGPLAASLDGQVEAVARQFPLPASVVREVAAELRAGADVPGRFWRLARERARGGLDELAQRLEPVADEADLVLPESQLALLRSLQAQVRRRGRVYDDWGFAEKSRRGLGLAALFHGPAGTGKTMAAEVLAKRLGLDLYRIDLSAVVDKYIGETEKNLRRLFDAAEKSGAVLLFDEADAIFGRRSEVRDSHDRYANLEVSYLLQRIESYRGLAILTTNLERALDPAFLRRLRFVVAFPFPGARERCEIWRRVFPASMPRRDLDFERLGQLVIAGGGIRNVAMAAAFQAADEEREVTMADLAAAARAELAKHGQAVAESQLAGWTA